MSDLRLFVRDGLSRAAQISDFTTLDVVLRHADFSTWQVTIPDDSPAADLLVLGAGLEVEYRGASLISGPVTHAERSWSSSFSSRVVTGADDTVLLADRLVYPTPSGLPFASEEDVVTGPAETVIHYFVRRNLGPDAAAGRAVDGLTMAADGGNGETVTGRGRLQDLIELVRGLALAGGDLGFEIAVDDAGTGREFRIRVPNDVTDTVVFSREFGNVAAFKYAVARPAGNHVLVGDEGEGSARTFTTGADETSVEAYGRIETLTDVRTSDQADALTLALESTLAEQSERVAFEVTAVDTDRFRFGDHYTLSDTVTAVVDGITSDLLVREVRLSASGGGPVNVTPVLSTPGRVNDSGFVAVLSRVRVLERRLREQERR